MSRVRGFPYARDPAEVLAEQKARKRKKAQNGYWKKDKKGRWRVDGQLSKPPTGRYKVKTKTGDRWRDAKRRGHPFTAPPRGQSKEDRLRREAKKTPARKVSSTKAFGEVTRILNSVNGDRPGVWRSRARAGVKGFVGADDKWNPGWRIKRLWTIHPPGDSMFGWDLFAKAMARIRSSRVASQAFVGRMAMIQCAFVTPGGDPRRDREFITMASLRKHGAGINLWDTAVAHAESQASYYAEYYQEQQIEENFDDEPPYSVIVEILLWVE